MMPSLTPMTPNLPGALLHVSLVDAPGAVDIPGLASPESRELVIDPRQIRSGMELAHRVHAAYGAAGVTVEGLPLEELQPGESPLVNGAVLVAGGILRRSPTTSIGTGGGPLVFVVNSGPDCGQLTALARGIYTIGRQGCSITIRDPELSRHHASVEVGPNHIMVRDMGSTNGTFVDGEQVTDAMITVSSELRFGNSRCSIAVAGANAPPILHDVGDPLPVHAGAVPERNRWAAVAALLPLLLGVVLAVTTGMWFFLAFSTLSAVTGVVPLLNHRRRERLFREAIREAADKDRARRRAVPDAGAIALWIASRGSAIAGTPDTAQPPPTPPADRSVALVRIGLARQPANIEPTHRPSDWTAPLLEDVPVLLSIPLSAPTVPKYPSAVTAASDTVPRALQEVGFVGPPAVIFGMARWILLQLGALHGGSALIVCWGSAADLPPAARFLPGVQLASTPRILDDLTAGGGEVIIVRFGRLALPEVRAATVLTFTPDRRLPAARILAGSGALSPCPGTQSPEFRPDAVSAAHLDRSARQLARAVACGAINQPRSTLAPRITQPPAAVPLWNLEGLPGGGTSTEILKRWREQSGADTLSVPVGATGTGVVWLDLVADGPHMLVAGTTGSGKSEFLRTFVLAQALVHPPSALAVLLIDFKGGSGLGTLAGLPHCVGLLTDLSTESVARALQSLRAELRRRESLFAERGVADIVGYRGAVHQAQLPRLMVVIDEFRMLSDEVPGAVDDLMKIATLGRSLGIHLLMATQRPQGAITSDIRANVTTAIALRMQSAAESQDVIGSSCAAAIAVDRPGRALLKVGASAAREFQCAALRLPALSGGAPIAELLDYLSEKRPDFDTTPAPPGLWSHPGLDSFVKAVGCAARDAGEPAPLKPVLPPLPRQLMEQNLPDSSGTGISLGLLDLPELQRQVPLKWSPQPHSHVALVGPTGSGASRALAHTVEILTRDLPQTHVYVLDGDATLGSVAGRAQVGAYVGPDEMPRAVRVLERLTGLATSQLASSNPPSQPVLLAISGWGRWCSLFRGSRFGWAEDLIQDICRDGGNTGISLLISGERDLITARFLPVVPNRAYFPFGAAQESLMTWPKLPPMDRAPGRAFVQGRWTKGCSAVAQFVTAVTTPPRRESRPDNEPFRVEALPPGAGASALISHTLAITPSGEAWRIPIGVAGDDLAPTWLNLPKGCSVLAVGRASTGKTNLLRVVAAAVQPPARCRFPDADAVHYWRALAAQPDASAHWRDQLLLVDDADRLPSDVQQLLAALIARGARAVLTAQPSPSLTSKVPLALQARTEGQGLVLAPGSPPDADLFGVRIFVDEKPIAGRAFVIGEGRSTAIQIALAATVPDPVPPERT